MTFQNEFSFNLRRFSVFTAQAHGQLYQHNREDSQWKEWVSKEVNEFLGERTP